MPEEVEWRHPELEDGEVFVGNFSLMGFNVCGHKTKRLGRQAYYVNRTPYSPEESKRYFPVFAQRAELQAAGVVIRGEYSVSPITPTI